MAGSAKLEGPMYEKPKSSGTLSPTDPAGPTGGKSVPDPLDLNKAK